MQVEGGLKHQLPEPHLLPLITSSRVTNQLARAAAWQVADNPKHGYNPLFLYGGVGLNRNPLDACRGQPPAGEEPECQGVVYLHSERFVADMVKALQLNAINEFKRSTVRWMHR